MRTLILSIDDPVCIGCNKQLDKKSVAGFCSESCKSYCNSLLNSMGLLAKAKRENLSPRLNLAITGTAAILSSIDRLRAEKQLNNDLKELKQTFKQEVAK